MTASDPALTALLAEVESLRTRLDAQEAELARLRPPAAAVPAESRAELPAAPRLSRRRMLTVAGAAAAAGVSVLARPGAAAAADGDPVLLGQANTATNMTSVASSLGRSTVSLAHTGGGSQLRLAAQPGVVEFPAGLRNSGEMFMSDDGLLFVKTATSSSDADWQVLNTFDTEFIYDQPIRAYDSRKSFNASGRSGIFSGGETRTIDLVAGQAVEFGATSAVLNVTVTGTSAVGFVALYGSAAVVANPDFSLLNWYGPNQTVANSAAFSLFDGGKVQVFARQRTHVIVDVLAATFAV